MLGFTKIRIKSMKNYLLIILLIFTHKNGNSQVIEAIDAQKKQENSITKKQFELIYEKVKTLPNQAQVSIAIIENGKVNFYGIKRIKDSILTINNDTDVFEIGSITKVFTATLLSNFVVGRQVELKDNINNYLDFCLKDSIEISFEQLATHTSGLPRVPESLSSPSLSLENPYKDYGEEKLRNYLINKLKLLNKPGIKCDYSNLGFGLLGYSLSVIDNTTYEKLLQTKIFSKYQMKNSTTNRNKIEDRLIKGLNDIGKVVPNWDLSAHMGAGGILSTAQDLSKFAIAQFDSSNKELELTRTNFFKVSDNYSMGLAWGLVKSESGAEWHWHNGGTGGYTSSMIINTKTKNGVIVLSNISALGELTSNIASLSPELMKTIEK